MANKELLKQIREIVREEVQAETEPIKKDMQNLRTEMQAGFQDAKKEMKDEIHKVYDDIAGDLVQQITSAASEQYSKLEKRVTRLDQHAGLPPME